MSSREHFGPVWRSFLDDCGKIARASTPHQVIGRLTRINGLVMEAAGLKLPLGSGCRIMVPGGGCVEAEVVGFNGEKLYMMPTDDVFGLAPGAHVLPNEPVQPTPNASERVEPRRRASDRAKHLPVGDELLGRVVDGAGRPLDSLGPLGTTQTRSLQARPVNPLSRATISHSLDVGIRAINALMTVGRGQRVGRGIPGYRARIRPIVSRITIHWPSFYNVVTGKTLALPNLIALQHIPLSPAGVIAKRPAPIALPNSCAAEWRMAPDAVFSPYASVRYFTPHMVHSQYNLL